MAKKPTLAERIEHFRNYLENNPQPKPRLNPYSPAINAAAGDELLKEHGIDPEEFSRWRKLVIALEPLWSGNHFPGKQPSEPEQAPKSEDAPDVLPFARS